MSSMSDPAGDALDFAHRWIKVDVAETTVLALHGTGGDENDLLPLADALAPGKNVLSPRGKVSEMGARRFFRRRAEGVFDLEDLVARTHELADFIKAAAGAFEFDPTRVVALGYSNGANIAASIMLLRPETLSGAALLRVMKPFDPEDVSRELPDLSSKKALVLSGLYDRIVPPASTESLVDLLHRAGADVIAESSAAGHELVRNDLDVAGEWFGRW
jgi:phospholipase/carboxylesterase